MMAHSKTLPAAPFRLTPGTSPVTVIATTDAQAFKAHFADKLDRTIFICDSGAKAIELIDHKLPDLIFADFLQLTDKWTGQRILKHAKNDARLSATQVFLMFNGEPAQSQWAGWIEQSGATGLIRKIPQEISKRLLGTPGKQAAHGLSVMAMDAIDRIFGEYAGPMRRSLVDRARLAAQKGLIENNAIAYVNELASNLTLQERREQFVQRANNLLNSTPA